MTKASLVTDMLTTILSPFVTLKMTSSSEVETFVVKIGRPRPFSPGSSFYNQELYVVIRQTSKGTARLGAYRRNLLAAVSYTHLDVYKRQLPRQINKMLYKI